MSHLYPESPPPLTEGQIALIERPLHAKIFLEGPAGSGKTTTGVERLLYLMASGVPADSILLILPQRTLALPYYQVLRHPGVLAGGVVTILTIGGLAQRMVELFWPLVAEQAGFADPHKPPIFLTLETAQYFMARLVRPLLEQGFFETVTIDRNRLYSQILDNLNKSAVVGFPYTQIGRRLKAAWVGDISQARVYEDAQFCATKFREHCLNNNLLDFSLQIEVFIKFLWSHHLVHQYLVTTYRHLIVDNLEEDTPVAHDLLTEWLPNFDSALLIFDQQAGYRSFLGADPESASVLRNLCQEQVLFQDSFVTSLEMRAFGTRLGQALDPTQNARFPSPLNIPADGDSWSLSEIARIRSVMAYEYHRYHPEMLDWVSQQIAALVNAENVSPGEIVVLAPFLSDALRFSLTNRLEAQGIPTRSHRPSRALREEPAALCLLTLAALAHPHWGIRPTRFDVAYAFIQAIEDMDLVRAHLLSEIVYRTTENTPTLTSFDRINPFMQDRITFVLGERYERLRTWIEHYRQDPEQPIDHFLSRLFGEVLSQPGYGFHQDFDAGEVAANLIESARKFRWVSTSDLLEQGKTLGQEYVEMVRDGVVAAQYIQSWQVQPENAVLLAPAYTFLMNNRPVDYQFWLDITGRGWSERLYQPLTHPYVLSRHWPDEALWTDIHEFEASQQALLRLAMGLVRRCRRGIFFGLSELSEQGYEHHGQLLKAIQRVLLDLPGDRGSA